MLAVRQVVPGGQGAPPSNPPSSEQAGAQVPVAPTQMKPAPQLGPPALLLLQAPEITMANAARMTKIRWGIVCKFITGWPGDAGAVRFDCVDSSPFGVRHPSDRVACMEGRFVDLEVRYTHLERQYAELSQTVFEHQKQIEALQRELVALRGQMHDLGDPVASEKPPHY